MIYTVILKPTKACNAQCTYCSSPPDKQKVWRFDDFKRYFDKFGPNLADEAVLIWHGGEPMLAGVEFYRQCYAYVQQTHPRVRFSMQTNLLMYSDEWRDLFREVFKGSISTSFDPDEQHRVINGSTAEYTRQFRSVIERVCNDGFHPMVVGTYTQQTVGMALEFYKDSLKYPSDQQYHLRINYRYPAGRAADAGEMLTPERYGEALIELYDHWISDNPDLTITPIHQMLMAVIGLELGRCPWLNDCAGHFLGIEPNGDVYNCADFADLNDTTYRFGNLNTDSMDDIFASPASRMMRRRRATYPAECGTCEHFNECGGGCMRDSVLYGNGLGGKFHYCQSWKMLFTHMKASVLKGELDEVLPYRFNLDPEDVKQYVRLNGLGGTVTPIASQMPKRFIPIHAVES